MWPLPTSRNSNLLKVQPCRICWRRCTANSRRCEQGTGAFLWPPDSSSSIAIISCNRNKKFRSCLPCREDDAVGFPAFGVLVAEIREVRCHAEIAAPDECDHSLQIVPLLSGDADLTILQL